MAHTIPKDSMSLYKSFDDYHIHKCSYCKKEFKHYTGEIFYKSHYFNKNNIYCSYNCKSKHKKKYQNKLGGFDNETMAL